MEQLLFRLDFERFQFLPSSTSYTHEQQKG